MDEPTERLEARVVGHYRILGSLGAGGMGQVFVAEDLKLRRKVAIKMLPESAAADHETVERMLREARTAAALDHPNICGIHEVGEESERPYIVMSYVEGETLAHRLARAPMTFAETVDIAIQLAAALEEAHAHGIVHRDMKPMNVMITPKGTVKVLDFGLAKALDAAAESLLTTPGTVVGTPQYMSPEQVRGETLDGRSDLFSLGVMLYEIAAGRRPFERGSTIATITAILFEQPAPIPAGEWAPLGPVIARCLEKDAMQRFGSAGELRVALDRLRRGAAFETPAPSPPPMPRRPIHAGAQELYLKARVQWDKRHPDALRAAIGLFQEAIEHDPLFARPYAGLADAYNMQGFLQALPPRDILGKAVAAARRAIELDPSLAEPHASLGFVHGMFEWDYDAATAEFEEAMRLDPGYAWAPNWYGLISCGVGQFLEAVELIELSRKLDPLSPLINVAAGVPYLMGRRFERAVSLYQQVIETEPLSPPAHFWAGLAYEALERYDEAVPTLERAVELARGAAVYLGALGHCYARAGRAADAERILSELNATAAQRYVSPINATLVLLGLRRMDECFETLRRSLEERTAWLWNLQMDARFDAVRADPRGREMLRRHGLSVEAPEDPWT